MRTNILNKNAQEAKYRVQKSDICNYMQNKSMEIRNLYKGQKVDKAYRRNKHNKILHANLRRLDDNFMRWTTPGLLDSIINETRLLVTVNDNKLTVVDDFNRTIDAHKMVSKCEDVNSSGDSMDVSSVTNLVCDSNSVTERVLNEKEEQEKSTTVKPNSDTKSVEVSQLDAICSMKLKVETDDFKSKSDNLIDLLLTGRHFSQTPLNLIMPNNINLKIKAKDNKDSENKQEHELFVNSKELTNKASCEIQTVPSNLKQNATTQVEMTLSNEIAEKARSIECIKENKSLQVVTRKNEGKFTILKLI